MGNVLTVKEDLPGRHPAVSWKQADGGKRRRRLARTRLADDGNRLTGHHREVGVPDGVDLAVAGAEIDRQILDFKERAFGNDAGFVDFDRGVHGVPFHRLRALGSSASRRASPSMMKLRTVMDSAMAG
ncbi:hypothetical protein D9M72_617500 [compost metagenome]